MGGSFFPVHDARQQARGVVHILGVERADPPAGNAAQLHGKLGIEREVDVGALEIFHEVGQLVGDGAVADLHVEEHDPAPFLGPAEHLLDELVRVAEAVFPPAPGLPCATVAMRWSAGTIFRPGSARAHSVAVRSSRGSISAAGSCPRTPMRLDLGLP